MLSKLVLLISICFCLGNFFQSAHAQAPAPTLTPDKLNEIQGCERGYLHFRIEPHKDNPKIFSAVGRMWCSQVKDLYGNKYESFRYFKIVLLDSRCPWDGCVIAGPPDECKFTSVICWSDDSPHKLNDFVQQHTKRSKLFELNTTNLPSGKLKLGIMVVGTSGNVLSEKPLEFDYDSSNVAAYKDKRFTFSLLK